jgi:alkylated DNA repair protein alkB family protein 1
VPDVVTSLAKSVVCAIEQVGYEGMWKNTYQGTQYRPEAGVVNYYQYKDTLMGHVDRSELNMDAPLVSIR